MQKVGFELRLAKGSCSEVKRQDQPPTVAPPALATMREGRGPERTCKRITIWNSRMQCPNRGPPYQRRPALVAHQGQSACKIADPALVGLCIIRVGQWDRAVDRRRTASREGYAGRDYPWRGEMASQLRIGQVSHAGVVRYAIRHQRVMLAVGRPAARLAERHPDKWISRPLGWNDALLGKMCAL